MIVENDTIYISDNLDICTLTIILKQIPCQNYKIPFRSNLKIHENKLIAVNQITIYFT